MSYQVLARKWRPRLFAEMVGQEHVLRTIINALDNDRLHHAFLFTGTRGVGKTTIARILAKSLNCERGVSSTPCGQCSACREIDAGRFVDLLEVDAASRTKVEDTRDILDNVQYAPTRGRYKVYLIDEVHMLSKSSFNALLKTLEEPPPHIKFLLATTDPQKLPVTVLSRCLQFNLKRLPEALIARHLQFIVTEEKIAHDEAALRQLARAADGSMRDALSLLDQAIGFGAGQLQASEVAAMLGTLDSRHVVEILQALAARDGAAMLQVIERVAEQSPDYGMLLEALLSALHRLAVLQMVPELSHSDASESDTDEKEALMPLLQQLAPDDLQLYYQIGLIGRRDLPLAPEPRAGLEMVLLRMLAFRPTAASIPALASSVARPATVARVAGTTVAKKKTTSQPDPGSKPGEQAVAKTEFQHEWDQMVAGLALSGMLHQLAVNCVLERRQDDLMVLRLDEAHAHLGRDGMRQRLQQRLQQYLGTAVRLELKTGLPQTETPAARQQREQAARQQQAEDAIKQDSVVSLLQETFNAQIVPHSIEPVD